MKKSTIFFLSTLAVLLYSHTVLAQAGYIYTVAGNGTSGFSGDGGPATNAQFKNPVDICFDNTGNMYIVDQYNSRIRKVDGVTHTISTVAGSSTYGYTGDGGLATLATLDTPGGVAVDTIGNIYIADMYNNVIRKVSTSGIITTIAGTGVRGISGDGGPATAAQLDRPTTIAVDNAGNIYFFVSGGTLERRIRKISPTGTITSIAGGGMATFSTDGDTATSVNLCTITHMILDGSGNLYFNHQGCTQYLKLSPAGLLYRVHNTTGPKGIARDNVGNIFVVSGSGIVKKNTSTGIIDTLVFNGATPAAVGVGDGASSVNAQVFPEGMQTDNAGNLYIADWFNNRIRMITPSSASAYHSDSLSVSVNSLCNGPELTILSNNYIAGRVVKTYFGDGSSDTTSLVPTFTGGYALTKHVYASSGSYIIKVILYGASAVEDSLTISIHYDFCRTLPISFYIDSNTNCIKDASESLYFQPLLTAVDSNGITVDTVSSTSGFNYNAYCHSGDIYQFHLLTVPGSISTICPVSGYIADTISALQISYPEKYFGLSCSASLLFDISVNALTTITGIHAQTGEIYAHNNLCNPVNAVVTLHFSPKFVFNSASITPTSISASSATWSFAGIESTTPPIYISYNLEYNTATGFLTLGDTVMSTIDATPYSGDIDVTNNTVVIVDTVRSSYDPNFIEVSPTNCINSGLQPTQLEYTIHFENTGTDTAQNIFVLDTLPYYTNPATLRIIMASAAMNIDIQRHGIFNVVKFNFPNIKLLDSTHHGLCDGAFIYTINTTAGIPDGTDLMNRAAIYFDHNLPVITNETHNQVGNCWPTNIAAVTLDKNIELYPNPATSELTIQTTSLDYQSITITNNIGQTLLQTPVKDKTTQISVATLPPGLYYITLKGNNGTVIRKFVKM